MISLSLWISTRLSKILACLLLQSILSLAFSSCLIRSPASVSIIRTSKRNENFDIVQCRPNVNCCHNRDLCYYLDGRYRRAWHFVAGQRQPLLLRGQVVSSHERQESNILVVGLRRDGRYSSWLYRLVRPIVRWYRRAVAVSLLVMFSGIAIAASTASQGSTATASSSSPSPTPFTKVANAVSNTFLIGATAAAGAALGRYFILTKEAEKEREILEKDVVPSLNSGTTNTKSPEVAVVPTLSTQEPSLTLSIAPTVEFQDDRENLVNETAHNYVATDVGTSGQVHFTTKTEEILNQNQGLKQESNEDSKEPLAGPMKEEKEDKKFKKFQWNTKNKRIVSTSAALSLQLIESDDEVTRAKTLTTLSEREKLTSKKAASIASSRFPFSSKLRSTTWTEGLAKSKSTPNTTAAKPRLAAQYAAMSPEIRAYTILLDLGLIQEHQDPDDPMYDNAHDDDYCI